MALSKISVINQITVTEDNSVQVRRADRILENDVVVAETYHRHVISVGDDYSNEDPRVQAVCAAVHTPEVIAADQASQEAIAQLETA